MTEAKSTNHAGRANDATCCQAKGPLPECRCHLSERLHQFKRITDRIPQQDDYSREDVAMCVWREQLRILASLAIHGEWDGVESMLSPRQVLFENVAQDICGIRGDDSIRSEPFTSNEMDLIARMEAASMAKGDGE